MSRLAFRQEGNTDRDDGVAVGGDETVQEGMAETLDSGGGTCEPGFGDANDFAAALG